MSKDASKETKHTEHKNNHDEVEAGKQLSFDEPVADDHVSTISESHSHESSDAQTTTQLSQDTHKQHDEADDTTQQEEVVQSVKAKTHTRAKEFKRRPLAVVVPQKKWQKILGLSVGVAALVALVVSGVMSQYYKNKAMPGVVVANVASGARSKDQIITQLEQQQKNFKITFVSDKKQFEPSPKEIGLQFNFTKTAEEALNAKRRDGVIARLSFWKKTTVPVAYSINDNLLNQYLEAHLPELKKAPQDSQLQFDADKGVFAATPDASGEGVDSMQLKKELSQPITTLTSSKATVAVAKKSPAITEKKIQPLVEPANELIKRKVVLTGLGYTFQAKPSDIASWLTPTPQANGTLKLVVDSAKVQSYVESVSKRISNAPVDRKVLKDQQTGAEVVLQEGRAGTELAKKQTLALAITNSLDSGKDVSQTMDITTAAFQTVNMDAYEKWIEVDLSEQRTTAYERATPVKNFVIASGVRGHETVTGEFAIWLKVRTQTMQGGSKSDGSYYNIPNVEWVSYFYQDYALHGAWWREKFGSPASHGCVNMTNADARWVYEWAPVGTKVIVHQ
jgi:lipoprotein-anchoring transpeptidase ErfK/SrfK